jgi:hypothetical protein
MRAIESVISVAGAAVASWMSGCRLCFGLEVEDEVIMSWRDFRVAFRVHVANSRIPLRHGKLPLPPLFEPCLVCLGSYT